MKKDTYHSLKGKTILIINTGSIKKRFILQRIRKLGLTIVILNKETNWAQPYVDHWILADTNDHQESIFTVAQFLKDNPNIKVDGAITFWEDDVLLASKITDKFNWIGIPYNVSKNVRNKYSFRKFCIENNILSPSSMLIQEEKDLKKVKKELTFPVVIKPVYGSSSAYVVKVEEPEELGEVYKYIKTNLNLETESALHDGRDIVVEEYIDGDEVDVDILMQNGKIKYYSITDNYKTEEPFFVETGESIPSSLSERRQVELFELAEESLEKLGVQNGCIHFEAKSNKNGAVPIEINLRMGGDEVYSIVKGAWGVDLLENAVKIALGIYIKKIKRPDQPKKYIIGQYFLNGYSGILSKLNVDEKVKKKKYLEELHLFKKIGEPILVPPEGFEYLGWATVSGQTMMNARNNMNTVINHVDYEVARFHPTSSIGKIHRKNYLSVASTNKSALLNKVRVEKMKTLSRENQRNLSIGIAYGEQTSDLDCVKKALMGQGYKVTGLDLSNIQGILTELKRNPIDFIFNMCESIYGFPILEPHATAIYDLMQIPYSGSNPFTLSLCIDKIKVKKLFAHHGIPTPKWDYAYSIDDKISGNLRYPLIVKPSNSDNSFGISNDSVVMNEKELKHQLEVIIEKYQRPALIEEYIEGDEFDICLIGNDEEIEVLPLIRSIFDMPKGQWGIYSAELKANTKFSKYIKVETPARVTKRLDNLLSEISMDVYNICNCHDYGKVEIRVDKNGNPYVLELNPNPPIKKNDFFTIATKLADYSYEEMIEEIIRLGIARYKDKPPFTHLQH